jgi:hypothetical protein
MAGRVEAGKSGGGISDGYDVVHARDEPGEPVRGGRTINAEQAAIVRRIFKMFADAIEPDRNRQATEANESK